MESGGSATKNARRASFMSSTTSYSAKRHASMGNSKANGAKKRAPLGDISNHTNAIPLKGSSSSSLAHCSNKIVRVKKGPPATAVYPGSTFAAPVNVKSSAFKVTSAPRTSNETVQSIPIFPVSVNMDVSPSKSEANSVSLDESMSTCDSFKSPDVEYIDNNEIRAVESINKKTINNLYISDRTEISANVCSRDIPTKLETEDEVVNVDDNREDPQLCATIVCDIYRHLRASETKKRPSTDFMENVQKDITASMRGILVDWLVEVAEEYRLVPETLHLTVNYIDRYLSGNVMTRQRLQLLGVSCMMIASKYEEICAPQVEEFCYITDNTYFRDEVLEMESSILNYLKFELTAPTAKCFLRRFVRAATRAAYSIDEIPALQLECTANYITELSLLEYNMLYYAPSLIAASAIFLAQYILFPSRNPWNPTLQHYTQYKPSDLSDCVKDLHRLCYDVESSTLPAIREKYSQHKYKCVAKKFCPPTIPAEFLHNQDC